MKKIFFVVLSFFIIAQTYASAQKMPWQNTAQQKGAPQALPAGVGTADMNGLASAVRSGDINIVKQIVTTRNVNMPDENGVFPLYVAAKEGSEIMVKLILERGADINYTAPRKKLTALCVACIVQNPFTIEALVKHKADPNKCPALSYLVSGKMDVAEPVELLIRNGAKVNAVGYMHATPLMLAAAFGKTKSVKVLLENKADPNFVSTNLTPLSAAFTGIGRPETLEIIKLLTAHGATLSAANAARKAGDPLWQDKFKASDFPEDKRANAEKVIEYINELATGKPHKAVSAATAVPTKAAVKKAVPSPKAAAKK